MVDAKLYTRESSETSALMQAQIGIKIIAATHGQCRMWVELRRTQSEQMSSELPPDADIAQYGSHFAYVPLAASGHLEGRP